MGVTSRSVITYMQELERQGFVVVQRRGQGKPNMYELLLKPVRRQVQK
jgi:predicted transcriptional regulator